MTQMLFGLFKDSTMAGQAVGYLKEKGYTKEISVLAHDEKYENSDLHRIKEDVTGGAVTGAVAGAITGALASIFSGITSIVVPGVGLVIGGPLISALGLTGGVTGALTGGVIGALVDLGINQPAAELYDKEIKKGQVLVGISTEQATNDEVRTILENYGATDITTSAR